MITIQDNTFTYTPNDGTFQLVARRQFSIQRHETGSYSKGTYRIEEIKTPIYFEQYIELTPGYENCQPLIINMSPDELKVYVEFLQSVVK